MPHNTTPWPADWPCTTLKTSHSCCTILHYGAHIVSCQLHNTQEIFWLSPHSQYIMGQPIRGGNPLCWPNFGTNPNFPHLPKHGIARLMMWEKTQEHQDSNQAQAVFILSGKAMQAYQIPEEISLQFTVTLTENKLKTDFQVSNQGKTSFEFTESQHAYFSISDINNIYLQGFQGRCYLDRVANMEETNTQENFHITKPSDLIFLHHQGEISIVDPENNRRICVNKNSRGTVVWNPYQAMPPEVTDMSNEAFHHFICVEPTNAQQTAVALQPGESSILSMEINVKEI